MYQPMLTLNTGSQRQVQNNLKMLKLAIPLITLALACCVTSLVQAQNDIKSPENFAVEGKISIVTAHNSILDRQEYSFKETVDHVSGSIVRIGLVGERQDTYFLILDTHFTMIRVDYNLVCRSINANRLVPELWYMEVLMDDFIQGVVNQEHLAGPAGFLSAILAVNKDQNKFTSRQIKHRKIASLVRTIERKKLSSKVSVRIDMVLPKIREKYADNLEEYTTVKVSLLPDDTPGQIAPTLNFTIDFYNFKQENNHESSIQLTETLGCSRFLQLDYPKADYNSFKMVYKTSSEHNKMIHYDQDSHYMRDESRIWDLNDGYLYVMNKSLGCSALNVSSDTLAPAYKPYDFLDRPLSVRKFMGLEDLAYLGQTGESVVFEGTFSEAPYFFGQTRDELKKNNSAPFLFVVKYSLQGNLDQALSAKPLKIQFISLHKLFTKTKTVQLIDELEVESFIWSEADESFMAPDCVDDESDMQRLELMVKFDGVHPKPQTKQYGDLFAANLMGLKNYIVKTILNELGISRLNLIEQEVFFAPNHVGIDLLIADRGDALALTYLGTALPPAPPVPPQDTSGYITSEINDERQCLASASLIDGVSFVFHCPVSGSREKPACIVLTIAGGFAESSDPNACAVYQFSPVDGPRKSNLDWSPDKMAEMKFNYMAIYIDDDLNEKVLPFLGSVVNYEIQHQDKQLTILDYSYTISDGSSNVRLFDAISYESIEDCSRMCELDNRCKSYSYCPGDGKPKVATCLLSSLDIRAAGVQEQLEDMDDNSKDVEVHDENISGAKYKLQANSSCSLVERDYLGAFRLTKEFGKLPKSTVPSIPVEPTVARCAQRSVELELSQENSSDHKFQVPSFAYCSSTKSCVLQESALSNKSSMSVEGPLCRLHKKRYQTYFDVSSQVLKLGDDSGSNKDKQHELQVESVEGCARACWPTNNTAAGGAHCVSFDFCGPNTCLINKIGLESKDFVGEKRKGCLHYEKSKLLLSYLDPDSSDGSHGPSFWKVMYGICLAIIGLASAILGITYGTPIQAKLRMIKLRRDKAAASRRDYAHFHDEEEEEGPADGQPQQRAPNVMRMAVVGEQQ